MYDKLNEASIIISTSSP